MPFIETYWDTTMHVCMSCCFELNKSFDGDEWPAHPADDEEIKPEERFAYRPGFTLSGVPIVVDLLEASEF